jgi:hypothetical protein
VGFNDDQRRRLAAKAKGLGRRRLAEVGTVGRVGHGNFAATPHRSVPEPLDSYGSCHPLKAAAFHQDHRVPPVARKELTRRSDELAQRRQELPWVQIDKE